MCALYLKELALYSLGVVSKMRVNLVLGGRECRLHLLDILLSVEQEAQDGAEELLDALCGRILLEVLLELYWSEVRQ